MNQFRSAIPSFITLLNLSCGFLVFVLDPKYGILLILLGALFDVFDGAIARTLNAQSELGAQLDSLADMVSFVAAPAFLLSLEFTSPYKYVVLIIVATGALRLAKFNISGGDTYYFKGLAVPASAMFFLGLLFASQNGLRISPFISLFLIVVVALLNVSTIKMFSFKGLRKDKYTAIFLAICLVVSLLVSFFNWHYALLAGLLSYILLSLLYHFQLSRKIV